MEADFSPVSHSENAAATLRQPSRDRLPPKQRHIDAFSENPAKTPVSQPVDFERFAARKQAMARRQLFRGSWIT
jgi:hypothetical protein